MSGTFPYTPAIQFGWDTMKKNFWLFVVVLLLIGLLREVPSVAGTAIQKEFPGWAALLKIVYLVMAIILSMGVIRISLKLYANVTAEAGDLFSCLELFLSFFAGCMLYGLIVIGGLILLIVPGIIWGIKYRYFGFFIVDKNLGPLEALKKSGELTNGYKVDLFLFGLLLALVNLAGALCLMVGLFATVPTTWMARAYIYRYLLSRAEEKQAFEAASPVISQ